MAGRRDELEAGLARSRARCEADRRLRVQALDARAHDRAESFDETGPRRMWPSIVTSMLLRDLYALPHLLEQLLRTLRDFPVTWRTNFSRRARSGNSFDSSMVSAMVSRGL